MGQFVFVVGFERCGTETIARTLRSSSRVGAFVAHEEHPWLFEEAKAYAEGRDHRTKDYVERLDAFAWLGRSMKVVCEANHRLGYFVRDLSKFANVKFVLLVRDPVQTIVSRIASLSHWPEIIDRYPAFFQESVKSLSPKKVALNEFRIKPTGMNRPLHEIYLQEWIDAYREITSQLADAKQVFIMETESIHKSVDKLLSFVGEEYFVKEKAKVEAAIKHGTARGPENAQLLEYAESLIGPHAQDMRKAVAAAFPNDAIIKRINA